MLYSVNEYTTVVITGILLFVSILNIFVIVLDEIITIDGEGMPSKEDPDERGNMYVHFKIIFPTGELSKSQKEGMSILKYVFSEY